MTTAARKARNVSIAAAGVVAIAAFLPWASFLAFSKSGISGDGIITLICAILGVVLIWRNKLGWLAQLVLALVVVLIGLYDLNQAGNLAASGLYLTFLAGIAWVIGAIMMRAARSSVPSTKPAESPSPGEPVASDATPLSPEREPVGDAAVAD